eukprot:1954815-Amphidinium_carterae.3
MCSLKPFSNIIHDMRHRLYPQCGGFTTVRGDLICLRCTGSKPKEEVDALIVISRDELLTQVPGTLDHEEFRAMC